MTKTKAKGAVPLKVFGKGGKATLKKYGKEHFVKIAKKRWAKLRAEKKKGKK